jgi:hypothetical protein
MELNLDGLPNDAIDVSGFNSSEMSVNARSTQRHIPEDYILHTNVILAFSTGKTHLPERGNK